MNPDENEELMRFIGDIGYNESWIVLRVSGSFNVMGLL